MKSGMKVLNRVVPYIYILPSIIFMFVFVFVPVICTIVMSFYKIDSIGAAWEFVKFSNYTIIFHEPYLGNALVFTLIYGVFTTVTGMVGGIFLALIVAKHRFLSFYRYVFYIPSIVSAVTMGRLWGMMFSPSSMGMINMVVSIFGIPPQNWLGEANLARLCVLGVNLIGLGGGMMLILFTTAINNVPEELNEAARLEGAKAGYVATRITLPLIAPVISSWMMLAVIGSIKSFEFIYALTSGGPDGATTTLAILLFENKTNYGTGAAMGIILTLIAVTLTVVYMRLSKFTKESEVEM